MTGQIELAKSAIENSFGIKCESMSFNQLQFSFEINKILDKLQILPVLIFPISQKDLKSSIIF